MFDLIIKGGTLVYETGTVEADIAVRDGRISAVGDSLQGAERTVDARGLHVLPGLVDLHVHFREPGMEYKEDFGTGSLAAAMGGVTTVFEMPNTIPPTATVDAFRSKRELCERHAFVDFGLRAALLPDNEDSIEGLIEVGTCSFKLFMGETVGGYPCPDDGTIFSAFRTAARYGVMVGCHAENNPVLQRLKRELMAAGRTDPRAHPDSRPPYVEQEAVARAAILSSAAGNHLHIHHLSTADGIRAVRWGRELGARITTEVLIGHLLLDDAAYDTYGNLIKLNPPIRPEPHVDALWQAIDNGTVNAIATDHAPHSPDEQARDNVWEAHGGFIGVETLLPLLTTQVAQHRLPLPRMVQLAATNPARIQGVHPRKGSLIVGADADLVLVDMAASYALDPATLHSKDRSTPYAGWPLAGRPVATYLRGQHIIQDGAQVCTEPTGSLLVPRRSPPGETLHRSLGTDDLVTGIASQQERS